MRKRKQIEEEEIARRQAEEELRMKKEQKERKKREKKEAAKLAKGNGTDHNRLRCYSNFPPFPSYLPIPPTKGDNL